MEAIESVLTPKSIDYEDSRVAYWTNASSKSAVVYVHGWTCSSGLWMYQKPLFKRYSTILIDLPGHGQSEAPHNTQYSMEHFARAVMRVLDEEHVSRAVLVGFSMGGPVVTMTLRLDTSRIAGIFYVDSFFNLPEHYLNEAQRNDLSKNFESDDFFLTKVDSFFGEKTTEETQKAVVQTMLGTPKHVRCNASTQAPLPHAWRFDEIYQIPATRIVQPALCEFDNKSWQHHLPQLKTDVWEDHGHFLYMEDPPRFEVALKGFMKEHGFETEYVRS
jgi:pimeloyl-ACP methyl ester carboxylesterase